MFCKSYCRPLTDAAASGEILPEALDAHLRACASCSDRFAAERALVSSIDGSLRILVAAPAPTSLVPRVRAAISDQPFSAKPFRWHEVLVPALMAAALMVMTLMIPRSKPPLAERTAKTEVRGAVERAAASVENVIPSSKRKYLQVANPKVGLEVRATSVSLNRAEIKIEPTTELAIRQLIRITREQPDTAKSLSANAEADSMRIKPIEVTEIAWAPLSTASEAQDRFEPRP
jgi:hypothetical protein